MSTDWAHWNSLVVGDSMRNAITALLFLTVPLAASCNRHHASAPSEEGSKFSSEPAAVEKSSVRGVDGIVDRGRITSQPLNAVKQEAAAVGFEELTRDRTGVDFTNSWKAPRKYEPALSLSFAGGGVCLGDYNGDTLPDIYLSRPFGGGKLYRNLGDFRFEETTRTAGIAIPEPIWEAGCSFVDIDGDTDLDLFVCGFDSPNRLFLNERGTFREVARAAGLDFTGASVMMAFADYDRDGDLDGYLVTNRPFSPTGAYNVSNRAVARGVYRQLERRNGKLVMPEHLRQIFDVRWNPYGKMDVFIRAGQYDRLYRNDGPAEPNGVPRFTEVTDAAGLRDNGMGLSALWCDFDDDGFPDLYVSNDYYGADRLYHNLGNGKFSEVSKELLPHTPWYSMGTNVADLNNDGLFDLMGTDMSGTDHFRQKVGGQRRPGGRCGR